MPENVFFLVRKKTHRPGTGVLLRVPVSPSTRHLGSDVHRQALPSWSNVVACSRVVQALRDARVRCSYVSRLISLLLFFLVFFRGQENKTKLGRMESSRKPSGQSGCLKLTNSWGKYCTAHWAQAGCVGSVHVGYFINSRLNRKNVIARDNLRALTCFPILKEVCNNVIRWSVQTGNGQNKHAVHKRQNYLRRVFESQPSPHYLVLQIQ